MRILVIEDDLDLGRELKQILRKEYVVDFAQNGEQGLFMSQTSNYDLVLIDISLPDINGTEICRMLRISNNLAGVIMLTGKYEEGYKVMSLDSGADDYITKPFSIPELLARVRAVLRRKGIYVERKDIRTKSIVLDSTAITVTKEGKKIQLRKKEFDTLKVLVENYGKAVSRERLLEALWEDGIDVFSNTVDVHIRGLRKKLDDPFSTTTIKTIYGVGYVYIEGGDPGESNNPKAIGGSQN